MLLVNLGPPAAPAIGIWISAYLDPSRFPFAGL